MPVSTALRRLLRIRDIQEDQHRQTLQSALAELHSLESALEQCCASERSGRELMGASAADPDPTNRTAARVETAAAARRALALAPRIESAVTHASTAQQNYLEKRVERRQAESLVDGARAADALQDLRQGQQILDDWYGGRRYRDTSDSRGPHQTEVTEICPQDPDLQDFR